MLNSIEIYKDAGRKVAAAYNKRDMSSADFHQRWFNRARLLENAEDRTKADQAYKEGWTEVRHVPTPLPF